MVSLIIDNIRYAVRHVTTLVFGQIRYIFNIHTMWELCSKMSHPVSSDSHFPVYHVDSDRILVKPGDKMDRT